jgi:hypothetical protein
LLTRDDVRDLLKGWRDLEWQVQGFGMLRTYLPGEGEPRLQVWDQRLASWSNNAIHDHPWALRSTVYAGRIFNQRFEVSPAPDFVPAEASNGHMTEIVPGTRGGQLSERPVVRCHIKPSPIEIYSMGDSYSQTHREMHITRYEQGTVTLLERFGREAEDIARVAWFGEVGEQPPFVNPYPPDRHVVGTVVEDSLRTWWLP